MKSWSLLLVCGWLAIGTARAEDDPAAKKADIRKMMTLTGSDKMAVAMMQQMIDAMKPSMPQVPEKFWTEFMTEVKPEELIDLIVPVYDKHFTHDDIKQLLDFYQTPVGQKVIGVMP